MCFCQRLKSTFYHATISLLKRYIFAFLATFRTSCGLILILKNLKHIFGTRFRCGYYTTKILKEMKKAVKSYRWRKNGEVATLHLKLSGQLPNTLPVILCKNISTKKTHFHFENSRYKCFKISIVHQFPDS